MPNEIQVLSDDQQKTLFSLGHLIRHTDQLNAINQIANIMANSKGLVPDSYINAPDKCMALIMQSGRWGLDPFAVAQKTFDLKGKIGYEGQLIQAIAEGAGWDFETEYLGDWSKVQGKHKKVKGNNGFYDVPDWNPEDEDGLAIVITGTNSRSGKVKTMQVDMKACCPRNSTNWTYNPQQQIHYSSIKQFTRRHCPSVVIGIQDFDDIAASNERQQMKDVTPKQQRDAEQLLSNIDAGILDNEQVDSDGVISDVGGDLMRDVLAQNNDAKSYEPESKKAETDPSPVIGEIVDCICNAITIKELNTIGLEINKRKQEGCFTGSELKTLSSTYASRQEAIKLNLI